MAALTFVDLYGSAGLALLVGENAATAATATNLKRVVNDAYLKHTTGQFWWNKRSFTYTTSSSPALPTAGNRTLNVPTTATAVFDQAYRLGYRETGIWLEVELVEDDEWLLRSAIRAADANEPRFARLTQSGSTVSLELNRPVSQQFLDTHPDGMVLEYFITPARLVNDADEPVCPDSLRPHLVTLAAYDWAMIQGDQKLMAALTRPLGRVRTTPIEEAVAALRRHDLTRTGKARTIRPKDHYWPHEVGAGSRDYGRLP